MRTLRRILPVLLLVSLMLQPGHAVADNAPFITEAYYRIKWGHFDEFMELFKKNHYPILKKLEEQGHLTSIYAAFPVNHADESSRWDFRMTLVIPNTKSFAAAMVKATRELYPDQETLKEEERHRFSLLLAHTDVVIREEEVSKW